MRRLIVFWLSLLLVFSAGSFLALSSEKEEVIVLPTMGNEWSYSVDNPDILLHTSFRQNIRMAQGRMNEWRFVGLKEGDCTITFTCPEYKENDGTVFMSRTCVYTYRVDKELNIVCVYMDEYGSETKDFASMRVSHTGQIIWSDNDNSYGSRPDSVEIVCYSNYNKVPVKKLVTSKCKNEDGSWLFSLSEFPDYKGDLMVDRDIDVVSVPGGYSRFVFFGHTILLYKEGCI